ncbi:1854_t:CDS:2 [Paraglomus occultum]|uniref:1854_t:CDS:1 n=1 Tax=Paraglomus occultum TaxID=144539 RepID=A0A9N9GH35_9GLOM|nr:1854_t:CDS:2 [Paraglomus occultum]
MAFDSHAFFLSGIPLPTSTNVKDDNDNTTHTMSTSSSKAPRLDTLQSTSYGAMNSSPTNLTASPVDFANTNIPTSITWLLMYTSPFIHSLSYFLSLITWSTPNTSESCLLLAAWWSVCLFPRQILVYGIHLLLLAWIGWHWLEKKKREKLGKPDSILRAISQQDLNNTKIDWSDPVQTQRVMFGLLYSYPFWLAFNYFVSLTWTFIIIGTLALIWNSPWFRVIQHVSMQNVFIRGCVVFIVGFVWVGKFQPEGVRGFSVAALVRKAKDQQRRNVSKKTNGKDGSKNSTEMVYSFVLYENQRWWLGLDWTTNLFPNERPAWSDEYNEATNNKDSFQLPPPDTSITVPQDNPNVMVRKTTEWRWVDPDWWIDMDGNVDKDGWEYADNHWKNFTGKGGFRRYTRRRKWIRTARCIETLEKRDINTSATPSHSSESRDKGSSSSSSPQTLSASNRSMRTISRGPDGKFELSAIEDVKPTPNGGNIGS